VLFPPYAGTIGFCQVMILRPAACDLRFAPR
jgi:hypothetical protein